MTPRVSVLLLCCVPPLLLLAAAQDEPPSDDDPNIYYFDNVTLNKTYHNNTRHNKTINEKPKKGDPLFPRELFSDDQLKSGAIVFHIIGVIYMFVALAIVCDEFFVPALDVIIEKLEIQDDVAGATFMAAGGSAPELFTSVIGVFVSFDDVGIGTIVGSAVFNILFVIGMCAIFSRTVLTLTWWPLFRDCFFYSISLIALIIFFSDNEIQWYEALVLFCFYIAYVTFMKWNQPMEHFVKKLVYKNKVTRVRSTDQLMPTHQAAAQALSASVSVIVDNEKHGTVATSSETSVGTQPGGSVTSRTASETPQVPPSTSGLHTGAKFRHGLLQLMIHTIDPLHDGQYAAFSPKYINGTYDFFPLNYYESQLAYKARKVTDDPKSDNYLADRVYGTTTRTDWIQSPGKVDEKATQLHAIASLKVLLDATKPQNGAATSSAASYVATATVSLDKQETTLAPSSLSSDMPNGVPNALADINLDARRMSAVRARTSRKSLSSQAVVCLQVGDSANVGDNDDPQAEAMDMSWPDGARKRITYVLLAPIVFPLWITLPDTRAPRGKKFFPLTFLGSIIWIAAFSYLMVWWANRAGETIGISPEVMGLTFLAAGTSIPDLITSVIVARKGFGDMAVSSSVGSNIFDVTVGLPVPWLLYGIIYHGPVKVNSNGMVCSITILFMMLLFVIMSIALFRWRMNKGLGFTMFLLYFVFVGVSLTFEYEYVSCPV